MKHTILSVALALAIGVATPVAIAQTALPGVTIIATGGTIAGAAKSNTDTTGYKSSQLNVQAMIDALPEMGSVATVKGEQFSNLGSNNITTPMLLKLAQAINRELAQPGTQGVVVTHGTDTLEETSFFLDLTTSRSGKPVVVVGAMRPATALSADGPLNLLQAVALAASPAAEKRGTMVALNDRISSGFYASKTNTTTMDTFRSVEQGYLGAFVGKDPYFFYSPATPTGKLAFDVTALQSLPKVAVVYMHDDQDNQQIDEAIRGGAKGVVIVGMGNAEAPSIVKDRIKDLTQQGFPVVRASRTGAGIATRKVEGIGSSTLNAEKARLLLMLALAQGADLNTIRKYFEG